MIRYLAEHGQSSDPSGPSYDADGLPLIPGLIEVITKESSAPGQRHAALADHVGEIAIRAWRGPPKDPTRKAALAGSWARAGCLTRRQPSSRRPSRASSPGTARSAAQPRRCSRPTREAASSRWAPHCAPSWGSLDTERGPSRDVTLQWATYYDAADQAGISRIYGGIHIAADDFAGRRIGSRVGKQAWELAQRYFAGTARR